MQTIIPQQTTKPDLSDGSAILRLLRLMRAEYTEIPGLHLTKPQVQRLWGLDPTVSDAALQELIDEHFLRQTSNGAYARARVDR